MLGQDGEDYAVSGCSDGTLGRKGVIDNHIRLTGVKNLDRLSQVDITYEDGSRWHDPCEGWRGWQIVIERSGEEQVDLYFEPVTIQSRSVLHTIILQYTDGTEDRFTATGPSGVWTPVVVVAPSSPTVSMLGQDREDYAVSGCSDGTLGSKGHTDNHIRISGVKNLDRLSQVDITYDGARWHDPCEGGRGWQIVVQRSGKEQLDLYFESATTQSVSILYTITLQYTNGTEDRFTVTGPSGTWGR